MMAIHAKVARLQTPEERAASQERWRKCHIDGDRNRPIDIVPRVLRPGEGKFKVGPWRAWANGKMVFPQ